MNPIEVMRTYTVGDGSDIVIDLGACHGSWIVDTTGREYLDCSSQFASLPVGWNHPGLQAVDFNRAARNKVANSDNYTQELADFTEKFCQKSPDFRHFFFVEGGAMAVENALKAAFDWKYRKLGYRLDTPDIFLPELDVVHLRQAFHGRSGYTLSLTNTVPNKTALFPKFNWSRITNPKVHFPEVEHEVIAEEGLSLKQAEKALRSNKVAAIILETVQGEGGDNHFRPEYFRALRYLADKYEAMLILDEVQTGVGLTGKWWAYQHFGIIPDMIAFGKKTQVCGVASTGRIEEVPDNVFHVSSRINSTWGGNLVDMVRFTAVCDIIDRENLVENAATVGNALLGRLKAIPGISNQRGLGLMIAFDLPGTQERNLVLEALEKKMTALVCGDKSIRLRPPLNFSLDEAAQAVEYIAAAVRYH